MTKKWLDQIVQLNIVTDDLMRTLKVYCDKYGLGPWQMYEFQEYKSAVCNALNVQFELICPTKENQFSRFLQEHKQRTALYGIQCSYDGTYDDAVTFFKKRDAEVLETIYPDGSRAGFCDAGKDLAMAVKLSENKDFHPEKLTVLDPGYPGANIKETYPEDVKAYIAGGNLEKCFWSRVGHLCVSTPDAMKFVKKYNDEYGIGPWIFVDLNEPIIKERKFRNKEEDHSVVASNCFMFDINIEINVGDKGKSSYSEFVKEHGNGFHHVMFETCKGSAEYLEFLTKKCGNPVDYTGTMASSGSPFYYVDTLEDLGFMIETFAKFPSPEDPPEWGPPLIGTYPV